MIGIPPEREPSALVHFDGVPNEVEALLKASRTARQRFDWVQAEQCAIDAREYCLIARNHVGTALAQIHLGDVYGDVGEIGRALKQCEQAYQILERQAAVAQRHNQAAAAYALGVLKELELFRNPAGACNHYRQAAELFKKAQGYWARNRNVDRFRLCQQVCGWIDTHLQWVIRERIGRHRIKATFIIWQVSAPGRPFVRQDSLRGHVIDENHALIDNKPYRTHPVEGAQAMRIDETNYCFALAVPKDEWGAPGAKIGDYIFVRQQWTVDRESTGVVWEPQKGWIAVDFVRGDDGELKIQPRTPRIIGDDPVGKLKGYIIALLKPE